MVDTAFVKSAKGWYYCEDSKISPAQDKDVVVSLAFTDADSADV